MKFVIIASAVLLLALVSAQSKSPLSCLEQKTFDPAPSEGNVDGSIQPCTGMAKYCVKVTYKDEIIPGRAKKGTLTKSGCDEARMCEKEGRFTGPNGEDVNCCLEHVCGRTSSALSLSVLSVFVAAIVCYFK